MTEATITIEDANGIKLVQIAGQLDESNVDEKIKDVYKIVEETPKGLNLIFDLEKLEYMNSKSIGYLTDLYGKITESGGKVAIASAKPNIIDILQVVGLTQLIQTFDTMEAAKMGLQAEAPAPEAATPATPEAVPAEGTPAPAPEAPAPEAATPAPEPTPAAPSPAPEAATPAPEPTPAAPSPAPEVAPEQKPAEATPAPAETPAPEAAPVPEAKPETAPAPAPEKPEGEDGTYSVGK